jgi:hypothetical protein
MGQGQPQGQPQGNPAMGGQMQEAPMDEQAMMEQQMMAQQGGGGQPSPEEMAMMQQQQNMAMGQQEGMMRAGGPLNPPYGPITEKESELQDDYKRAKKYAYETDLTFNPEKLVRMQPLNWEDVSLEDYRKMVNTPKSEYYSFDREDDFKLAPEAEKLGGYLGDGKGSFGGGDGNLDKILGDDNLNSDLINKSNMQFKMPKEGLSKPKSEWFYMTPEDAQRFQKQQEEYSRQKMIKAGRNNMSSSYYTPEGVYGDGYKSGGYMKRSYAPGGFMGMGMANAGMMTPEPCGGPGNPCPEEKPISIRKQDRINKKLLEQGRIDDYARDLTHLRKQDGSMTHEAFDNKYSRKDKNYLSKRIPDILPIYDDATTTEAEFYKSGNVSPINLNNGGWYTVGPIPNTTPTIEEAQYMTLRPGITGERSPSAGPKKYFDAAKKIMSPNEFRGYKQNLAIGNPNLANTTMRKGGKMCYGCGGAMHNYGGRMDGIQPNQAKYGKWLDLSSNILGATAGAVGNFPVFGQALGAGLGTLAGATKSLAENAATSEDGGVDWKGIDWGDMALQSGVGAGAGALGAAGSLAVGAGGAGIDALTTSKYEKKEAMYQDILANPEKYSLEQFEEALGRQEEMGKNSGLFNAINAGVGIAGSIAGGKVDKAGDAALKGAEVATDVAKTADTVVSASDNILPEAFDAASAAVDATKTAETAGNFITKANNVADNKFVQQGVSMGMDALDKVDQANTQETVGKELTAQQKRAEMLTNDPDSMYYNPINQPINMATAGASRNGGRIYKNGGKQNKLGGRMYYPGGYLFGPAGQVPEQTNTDNEFNNMYPDISKALEQTPLQQAALYAPIAKNIFDATLAKSKDYNPDFVPAEFVQLDSAQAIQQEKQRNAGLVAAARAKGFNNPSTMLALNQALQGTVANVQTQYDQVNARLKQAKLDKDNTQKIELSKLKKSLKMQLDEAKNAAANEALTQAKQIAENKTANKLAALYATMGAPDMGQNFMGNRKMTKAQIDRAIKKLEEERKNM